MNPEPFFSSPVNSINVGEGDIAYRIFGRGPALLMLHGNPQTHAMWHALAPSLSRHFTVVCPDLRGYGRSYKPAPVEGHHNYSKRAMAADMVKLMSELGFDSFLLAGHDRGGRVAHRLALDNPTVVQRLLLLDIVPTLEHFERADQDFAMGYYHWFWLAQPHPFPETLINANPVEWFFGHTSREPKDRDFFQADALASYLEAVNKPEMIRGMCEDYRAAATIDLEHDRNSRSDGRKILCPLHVLWGNKGKIGKWYEPLDIWSHYVSGESQTTLSGGAVDSGHYLAEEASDEVLVHFETFFGVAKV